MSESCFSPLQELTGAAQRQQAAGEMWRRGLLMRIYNGWWLAAGQHIQTYLELLEKYNVFRILGLFQRFRSVLGIGHD